jgi:hypothetical protein
MTVRERATLVFNVVTNMAEHTALECAFVSAIAASGVRYRSVVRVLFDLRVAVIVVVLA